jgi:hypothetical protein
MNFPRVVMAAVAAWVLYLGVSFVVHTVLLNDLYMQHVSAMRPEAEAQGILPVGFGFALLGFFAFAYAYAKGYEGGSGMQEGLRFGVIVGLLLCCFGTIWDYMVWPVSPTLAAAWMVDYIIEFALYGALVGAIYKPVPRHARSTATAV